MSPDTASSIRLERSFTADPDTVFRAWTERERVLRWSCREGATLEDVTIDLRVGGSYELLAGDLSGAGAANVLAPERGQMFEL